MTKINKHAYQNDETRISCCPYPYYSNPYLNPYKREFAFIVYDTKNAMKMFNRVYNENKKRRKNCGCFICGDSPAYFEDVDNAITKCKKIKVKHCTEHIRSMRYLCRLIQSADYTITEDIIRKAVNSSWTFENIWKYDISYRVSSITSPELINFFLNSILDTSKDFEHHLNSASFEINSLRRSYNNILVLFHTFGFYLQVNSLIKQNKLDLVYLAILQYIDAMSTNFSKIVKYYTDNTKPTIVTSELILDLESMLKKYPGKQGNWMINSHTYFEDLPILELTQQYKEDLENENLEFTFSNLWHNIIKKHIYKYANFDYLKEIVDSNEYEYDKVSNTIFLSINDSNKDVFYNINVMSMFNIAGLFAIIEFLLLLEDYNKIVLAIEQVMTALTSKFNIAIDTSQKDKVLYTDLIILLNTITNN